MSLATPIVPDFERMKRVNQTMVTVRWAAAIFGFVQILTFYLPYPPGVQELAIAAMVVFVLVNVGIRLTLERVKTPRQVRNVAIFGLVADTAVVQALVWTYTFDPDTAIWAVMFILPLEGALLFQRRGALIIMAVTAALYTVREFFGAAVYGSPLLPTSITFRMGIGFLIAYVAGTTALSLSRERAVVEDANRHLDELNKSMREFVAIASHDMRTPLSVINGVVEYLTSQWEEMTDDDKRQMLSTIQRQGHNLDRLVNDLLTTSRIDAGAVDRREETLLVTEAVENAIESTKFNDELTVDIHDGIKVLCDPEHFRRMVANLLTNSSKYGQPPFCIRTLPQGDMVDIRIEDRGNGVPEEFRSRLFDRFSRAENHETESQEGTGLGLAIVKGLAEANGGSVRYDQNVPSGAVFIIRLPRADS